MGLGKFATRSILDSPEAEKGHILNVSIITWSSGEKEEHITTTTTDCIFQDKSQNDFFHITMQNREDVDAVVYLEPNTSVDTNDKFKRNSSDIIFDIDNIVSESGYKMLEISEVE